MSEPRIWAWSRMFEVYHWASDGKDKPDHELTLAYLNALEKKAALADELADWMQWFDVETHFKDTQQDWLKRYLAIDNPPTP